MANIAHAIEIALLILAAYLGGCALGYGLHRLVRGLPSRRQATAPMNEQLSIAVPPHPPMPDAPQPQLATPRSGARRLARAVEPETPSQLQTATALSGAQRPPQLPGPRGTADDLKQIKGIGRKTESSLNDLGIYHFHQIAAWQPSHVDWLEGRIAIKGRIRREQWIEQATLLATATGAAMVKS